MHIVLAMVPMRHEESLMRLTNICHLSIKVEVQRPLNGAVQCHRCQQFGHTQTYCNDKPKCVKCGKQHSARDCELEPEAAPICANCGGSHPANYMGCSKYPKIEKQTGTQEPARGRVQQEKTFAQTAQGQRRREEWPTLPGTSRAGPTPAAAPTETATQTANKTQSQNQVFASLLSGNTLDKLNKFLAIQAELEAVLGKIEL